MDSISKSHRGYLLKFLTKKDSGWALGLFGQEDNLKLQIKIKGQIGEMKSQVLYEIQGAVESHQKFGTTFQVENYQIGEINSPTSTIKYLASPVFPGIGVKAATKIVEYYQNEVLVKIKNNPTSLYQVPGLSQQRADLIIARMKSLTDEADLRPLFYEQNLSVEIYDAVKKMCETAQEMESLFSNNFLGFARKHRLRSFEQVDKIALHFGLVPTSDERIGFWAERIGLNLIIQTGNTYTDLPTLKQNLKKKMGIFDDELIQNGLIYAKNHQLLYFVDHKVYCAEAWEDEQAIVEGLCELQSSSTLGQRVKNFNQYLVRVEQLVQAKTQQPDFHYDQDQIKALKTFLKDPITLITGGPGTGKTTLIQGLILLYEQIFPQAKIGIAAPTGRAAARLKEALQDNRPSTIHKMLEADENGTFGMNADFPLSFDLIILDEMSMVENHLFAQIIKAKGKRMKKIVLVGDHHQLPPVGYGAIFEDLIASQQFAFCDLKVIHRQNEGNGIIDLALAIQEDRVDELDWNQLKNVEFYFDQALSSNYQMLQLDYAVHQKSIQQSPFYYQIIAPFYAGELGIEALNNFIQTTFNENLKSGHPVYDRGRYRYAIKDKIMNLKNNTELDLTNGEVGIINEIQFLNHRFIQANAEFSGDKIINLDQTLFNDLALGYACSVHKTQGSEYTKVAFILEPSKNNFFLTKQLIYTAITRAKSELLIIGDYQLFLTACQREVKPRLTTIGEKLAKLA